MFIIIGNVISAIAAVFTALSSLSSGKKKIYGFQTAQCLTMAVAEFFFSSYSGVTTFILCALRNYLLTVDKYSRKAMIFFLVVITGVGLVFNNRGIIGIIPVAATVIYTLGQYYFQTDLTIKINIIVNLVLWAIYDLIISDYVSAVVDSITVVLTLCAIARILAHKE